MSRVNVTDADGDLVGWFDPGAARRWTDRDGVTGAGSGGPGRGEAVNLTATGKWVKEQWSNWDGEPSEYRYITADEARSWLLLHGEDEAVAELWGSLPAEATLGAPVTVGGSRRVIQAPDDLWAAVDEAATAAGVSGAEIVRRATAAYLQQV